MSAPDTEEWIQQCRSNDPARQTEAIQQLLKLQADAASAALSETLKSPDAVVRYSIAAALGHLGGKDSAPVGPVLLELLKDPEAIVRSEAADALGMLGYNPAAGALRTLLLHDRDPLVRASAAESLGDVGDAAALADLEVALRDADDAVRGYAANSIGLLGVATMPWKLERYAQEEPSPRVKAEIYGACYRLGAGDCGPLLELLEASGQELGANILNLLNDLTSRKLPPNLAADSGRIQSAVASIARRIPMLAADAEQILARLARLSPRP